MSKYVMTKFQLDALVELGNIGMGHATIALSKMLKSKVQMTVPYINFMPVNRLPEMFGDIDTLVAGVYLSIDGAATGKVLMLFPRDSALKLADMMMDRKVGTTKVLSEIDLSALMEVCNILVGSYLTAMNDFTGLKLQQSVPRIAFDMIGAVMDFLIIEASRVASEALVIETELKEPHFGIKGYFIFLLDPESPQKILKALGVEE